MLTYSSDKKSGSSAKAGFHLPRSPWCAQHPHVQQILRSPSIQTKLTIGASNDKYEQEADRVADQVMRMSVPQSSGLVGSSLANHSSGTIQRVCAPCAEEYKTAENENRPVKSANLCPKCQTQEPELIQTKLSASEQLQRQEAGEEEEEVLQAKTIAGLTPEVTPAVNSDIQSLQGGGQPLSRSERSFFEPRFGADFSGVRIHSNMKAANTARSINARAFTNGPNIIFGAGEYAPDASAGRKLLAHELTHVVQQKGAGMHSPSEGVIQRFDVKTTGTAPHGWTNVPEEDVPRIARAMNILLRVMYHDDCIAYFRDNTPGGTATTTQELYNNADLWKHPSQARNLYGEGERPGSNIAYTQKAYDVGAWTLAGTFVHELMHNAGQSDEQICEDALHPCGRLPQVPVGERDTGGISPVIPGLPFYMAEVRRLLNNPNYMFLEAVGDAVGCSGRQIFVNPNHSFWSTAYTAQVRNLAQASVDQCFNRQP